MLAPIIINMNELCVAERTLRWRWEKSRRIVLVEQLNKRKEWTHHLSRMQIVFIESMEATYTIRLHRLHDKERKEVLVES